MATSPLNDALNGLGTTIDSITQKVETGKQKVKAYKEEIVQKLSEVIKQLEKLKENQNIKDIPKIQGQLLNSNEALQKTTESLNLTKKQLDESNAKLENLQQTLDGVNTQLANVTAELAKKQEELGSATDGLKEKDATIQSLNEEMARLQQQKAEAEKQVGEAQGEVTSLIDRIGQINQTLVKQIELIDTIAGELGNNEDVMQGFAAISRNIEAIVNLINNPDRTAKQPTAASNTPLYDKYSKLSNEEREAILDKIREKNERDYQIIMESFSKAESDPVFKRNIQNVLSRNSDIMFGGRRKRRTMKRRGKKTRKLYKGGYVYSSSKQLDESSSIITSSSDSNSNSNSKTKSRTSSSSPKSKSRRSSFKKRRITRKRH